MIELPAFYVANRVLTPDQVRAVIAALSITPVAATIISDLHDGPLARDISSRVLRVSSSDEALELAREIGGERPVVVIGDAPLLDAHYADGHMEAVAVTC